MAGRAEFVAVGRITRAHGVKGELAVLPLSQVEARFEPGSRVLAGPDHRPLTVAAVRLHRSRLLVTFDEITDRMSAEAVAGSYLFVAAEAVPAPPEGEYWPHELVGCRVETTNGRALGEIREVVHGPANDLWVAKNEDGAETLIPALKDVVRSVDVETRRVEVAEIPGLTVPETDGEGNG
jgi:16S rRNA processing protein RimM